MSIELSLQRKKDLHSFLDEIKIDLKNIPQLDLAFTHSSYIKDKESSSSNCNEQLEFLGDAVLKLVVSSHLMEKFPHLNEGELSKFRAYLVSDKVLGDIAKHIGLGKYILSGKSERKNMPSSILANCYEALLAVIYRDCGLKKAKEFIINSLEGHININLIEYDFYNYKAVLQEYTQDNAIGLPSYKTLRESGPEHNKEFEVAVILNNNIIASGNGKSKKEASQQAAKNALIGMKII